MQTDHNKNNDSKQPEPAQAGTSLKAVDSVYRTRSLGVAATGLPDQYADGKAAKVWELYIGSKHSRTGAYKEWIGNMLRSRSCENVLDVACGNGVDSIMLLEEGFKMVSTDASDKMLKYALQERWARRKETAFDKWIIEEANWLNLVEDLDEVEGLPEGGFDAVICLGNSFAHLPDFTGELKNQRIAVSNFYSMLRPGGILIIDHRNYDAILDSGTVPAKNIYYNSEHIIDIKTSNLYVNGRPTMVTLDYTMDGSVLVKKDPQHKIIPEEPGANHHTFRLSYYPHRLEAFNNLIKDIFGEKSNHNVYGDFKEFSTLTEKDTPAYYIHVCEKPK
ncbi:unnamed protein product [Owenia fusiformis]|uniref:Glycine N-methyltransferase n=1 Tax=Owenia fusiformis TaxID=6347 RepID=A0A8J1U393_OWEFU|nr:unnamed protein product [Owenia fusiformis]